MLSGAFPGFHPSLRQEKGKGANNGLKGKVFAERAMAFLFAKGNFLLH